MTAISTTPRASAEDAGEAGATFRLRRYGRCTLIEVAGEVDVGAAATLRQILADAPTERQIIDLSGITVMDSVGVSVLVAAWRHAASIGGAVRLVRPYRSPLKVLQDTRVDRLLPILDDVETALRLDRAAGDGIWDQSDPIGFEHLETLHSSTY